MRTIIILLPLTLLGALPLFGQTMSVPVSISLQTPSPTCSLTNSSDLDFGTVEKPGTGTGSVVINALTGVRTSPTLSFSGTATVGQVRLNGLNVNSYTVSRTFPSTLTSSSKSLTFSGTWAESTSSNSGYTAVSASSHSGTSTGAGASFNHYYRFGGTVSGIDLNDTNGTYSGTIQTTASCN